MRNWKRGRSLHPNGYPYVWGELALQSWQKDLARAATLSEDQQKQLFFADWWNYEAFQDARTRAAAFLKDEAPNLGDKGRDAVLRAAALYEQEGKLLVAQIQKPEGFLGPWSGKGFADWTPAVREREQQILAQALGLEQQAIAEIEASLKAEGASAPEPTTEAAAPSSVRREDGKVWIEGLQEMNWGGSYFAHQDTFMACMTEILRCAGKDVTYAEVMGLSASAFKITMMENCHPGATQGHVGIAAWAPDGTPLVWEQGGETINFHSNAMRVFGITWSHIDLNPKDTPDWRKQLSAAVRASVDRGVPLFYMDGEWGLIVGYREDGSAFICKHEGMGSGYEEMERPRGVIGDVWWANTVVLDRPPVPRRQAMVDSLRSAALMWRAEGPEEGLYHGRSGYETWIRVLGDPGDDVMLHGNAFCYASLLTSRRAAAEYLRMVADELGGATAGHLGAAADAYESIADCLYAGRECVTWPWPEKWTPENRATETGILRQCMAEEAKAVAQIEAALHTLGEPVPAPVASNGRETAPVNVRREDGKVWIEGMEGVNWGGSFFAREDSQARCLVEALRCAGQDVTYSDVMGLSGAAFKITMAPNMFVGEMHSEMGMDWKEITSRVWGLDYDWQAISMSDEENPNWREQLRQAAAESLGRGMPLFYMNGEWNLLVGYREDGSAFVCKPYAGEKPVYTESKIPGGFLGDAWFASVLRPAGKPADRRDSVLKSLRTAVELATHPAKKDGSRLFGPAAYEAWIAALEEDRKDASKHGNAFSYSQLLTSRRAAAEYLRKVADELGADAAPHLRTAADRYDAVAKRLDEGRDCVMWPWEENWTPENRGEEAAILRQCLADEKVAVSGIATALAALGETAPAPTADAGDAVLLQGAVADFKHIADDVAGHRLEVCARGADETLYPQPYCYLTTMLVQMHAAGWKEMDLDTLAAVSGASAMFAYEEGEFGPKYAFHRRNPNGLVAEATGYATEAVPTRTAEDAYKFVKESVDSGRPVSAWEGEMMLLAGYQDAAAATDCKVFAMKDGNGYYAEWWGWDRFSKWVGRPGRVAALPPLRPRRAEAREGGRAAGDGRPGRAERRRASRASRTRSPRPPSAWPASRHGRRTAPTWRSTRTGACAIRRTPSGRCATRRPSIWKVWRSRGCSRRTPTHMCSRRRRSTGAPTQRGSRRTAWSATPRRRAPARWWSVAWPPRLRCAGRPTTRRPASLRSPRR